MDLEQNACYDDIVVENVWKSALFWWESTKPRKRSHFTDTKIFDQHKAWDDMGCTVYGLTHTKHDTENTVTIDPKQKWAEAVESRGADKKKGRSLGSALRFFKSDTLIEAYSLVEWVEAMKDVLFTRDSGIYTGSNHINWTATRARADKMAVYTEKWLWHAYEICGYDDGWQDTEKKYTGAFECKNSNDNFPRFRVPYEKIDMLFSTIEIITNEKIKEEAKKANDKAMIDLAIAKGITNGDDLDNMATREQVAVMIYRLNNANMEYKKASIEAVKTGIWNGQNGDSPVVRYEVMIMCGRYIDQSKGKPDDYYIGVSMQKMITNGTDRVSYTTRRDAILMITRTKNVVNV